MENLTYETLVPRLVEAVPEVPVDSDQVENNLAYLVFSDLMRFVNSLIETDGNRDVLEKIFQFVEDAARMKDKLIDSLLMDSLYLVAVAPTREAKKFMGPHTEKLFRRVESEVYGN